MKLSTFKQLLENKTSLSFTLPNGIKVPAHFHITEAGLVTKNFIDCGGTVRTEKTATIQLWTADDYDHRLDAEKLRRIITLSESLFGTEDLEVEVEYQTDTISRFGLDTNDEGFLLTAKQTDCLAKENCGIPETKPSFIIAGDETPQNSCTPGGGCC